MTNTSRNTFVRAVLDGVMALVIVSLIVVRNNSFTHDANPLLALRIRAVDALFGFLFVFLWQFAFTTLNQFDGFTSARQKFFSTTRVVTFLTLATLVYLWFFHRSLLSGRTSLLIFACLLGYELNRRILTVYVGDLIAARDPQRVVILGSGRRASKAWRQLRTESHNSVRLIGFVDDRASSEMPPDVASRYIGTVDDLSSILLREVVDVVLIAMPIQSCYPLMQRGVHLAQAAGSDVVYLDDIYSSNMSHNDVERQIFRELAPRQQCKLLKLMLKRVFDIVGAAVGLIAFLPLCILVALAIKLTSEGPVLFVQERYGLNRRIFRMLKFRSMVANAEALLPDLEVHNEADGPIFKIEKDPRITFIGNILRKLSIDELPQLWNVLMGDMSLVGPRPMTRRDVSLFSEATIMRRFKVKPGITGLWQVSGRSSVGFDQWVSLDSRYIDDWSFFLDIKILLQTFNAVFRRSGAM